MGLFDLFKKKPAVAETPVTPVPDPATFPSYEHSIEDTDFVVSKAARSIWESNRPRKECAFFAQCVTDNRKYLDQFRVQSASNPFVKNIGNDCEGVRLLALMNSHCTQILSFLDLVPSQMNLCLNQMMDAFGEASDTGETEAIEELAIDFMDPYIRLLALYNDIATIDYPPHSAETIRCFKKAVLELMETCVKIYDSICAELFRLYNDLQKQSLDLNLSFAFEFSNDSLPKAQKEIMAHKDVLLTYLVRRKKF